MRLKAEIRCYLCGEVSGTWEWLAATGSQQGTIRALQDDHSQSGVSFTRVRCLRCGGSVYLDAVEPVRLNVPVPAYGLPSRPGRPRKQAQRLVS
jgi:hypothetical protein